MTTKYDPPRDAAFKEKVVRAIAAGLGVSDAAKRFNIVAENKIYGWLTHAGLKAPYGEGYPKTLPPPEDGPLFTDPPPRPAGAPPEPRRAYSPEFKRTAVRALALAVAEGESGPVQAVAVALDIGKGMLRDWAYNQGYMAHGGGLDWDKLRKDGSKGPGSKGHDDDDEPPRHKPPSTQLSNGAGHHGSVPVLVLETTSGRQEITIEMLRALWNDRERLLHENGELKRQREVFMAATTIFGNERTS